jgi:hypothetical protein
VLRHAVGLNPAASVCAPRDAVVESKTPALSVPQARPLLSSLATTQVVSLRDRAIMATLTYTTARVGNDIYRMVKRRLRGVELPARNLSCHSVRATPITALLTRGVPLNDVPYFASPDAGIREGEPLGHPNRPLLPVIVMSTIGCPGYPDPAFSTPRQDK